MLRVRLPADLDVALERLKNQRHVNVSSWVRAALRAALKHELHVGAVVPDSAPDPTPPPTLLSSPISGWRPRKLPDGSWGSLREGDTRALPADLVGQVIVIETQTDGTWQAAVREEIERTETYVLVRDSGKPSDTA